MPKRNSPIVLIPLNKTSSQIETSINALNQPLANFIQHIGLPTENILSSIEERRRVICSLESALEVLPLEDRAKANYLSKFTVAITVGLFDGALTFLWDETIKSFGSLIDSFDLQYFYNVAESVSSKYKNLHNLEDLEIISAHDLLEISKRIGLINDVNFHRLQQVNYMRNHASSAHPNENEVTGIEILSMLETCLKYVITAKPDHSVIRMKQLLENIRKNVIPDEDFAIIGEDISKQPQERIDDFLLSIFGVYCDPKQEQNVKVNIEKIIPYVWNSSTEEIKYKIGSKYGWYIKNGDIDRKKATQKVLELVDGLRYRDENSLASELFEKLQDLKTVHFELNNFHNEYFHAKSIEESIPKTGVPTSTRKLFVKVICICYCGNGKGYKAGVDENALPYYEKFIKSFSIDEIKDFLILFKDSEFVHDLITTKADQRMRDLAEDIKAKTTNVHVNKALDIIINFPKLSLTKVANSSVYETALKYI